jgi:mannosyl-oligosaccharide alpha-1,2-mannosidase
MEMKYLSHLTGNKKYWDKAEQVMERIRHLIDENQTLDGLVPILIEYVTLYASCFLEKPDEN